MHAPRTQHINHHARRQEIHKQTHANITMTMDQSIHLQTQGIKINLCHGTSISTHQNVLIKQQSLCQNILVDLLHTTNNTSQKSHPNELSMVTTMTNQQQSVNSQNTNNQCQQLPYQQTMNVNQ